MEYYELQKEGFEARSGADRMAIGLPCIPDRVRGDLAEVTRLRQENERLRAALKPFADAAQVFPNSKPEFSVLNFHDAAREVTFGDLQRARIAYEQTVRTDGQQAGDKL